MVDFSDGKPPVEESSNADIEIVHGEAEQNDFPNGKINCPDCDKAFEKPEPGQYRCPSCYCKLSVGYDSEVTIIPYFNEMNIEPFIVMLGVLGVVLLVAAGDHYMSFSDRLSLFTIIMISVYGIYRLVGYFCSKKRGVDRFFRRWSRTYEENYKDPDTLIRIETGEERP